MNTFLKLFFLLLFASLSVLAGPSSPLTDTERQQIRIFGYSMLARGRLLTPPVGAISPTVRKTQKVIDEMVDELYPELRAGGVHIVVNIYGSSILNAWARLLDPKTDGSQEYNWLKSKSNNGQIWPLRKAWGFRNDGKPIFEIGLTSALIENCDSKDELAFYLGHELRHVKEGHVDPKENVTEHMDAWWSSQSNEIVADDGSLESMVGKYELSAAVTAMEKVYPSQKESKEIAEAVNRAFNSGTASHHSEGLRLSTLQAGVEHRKRFDKRAAARPLTPMPDIIRYDFKREIHSQSQKSALEWLAKLNGVVDRFKRSGDSKANQVVTFFDIMHEEQRKSDDNVFRLMNSELKYKLKKFLLENTLGDDAFTLSDFRNYRYREDSLRRMGSRMTLMRFFFGSEEGRKFVGDLAKLSPFWAQFTSYWSTMDSFKLNHFSFGTNQSIGVGEIKIYIDFLSQNNPSNISDSLRERLKSEFLGAISAEHSSTFYQEDENGRIRFFDFVLGTLWSDEREAKDPQWAAQLKKAFEPHVRYYVPTALGRIREKGILSCKDCVSFYQAFTPQEMAEAVEVLESELKNDPVPEAPADSEIVYAYLFEKYQNDRAMTFKLITQLAGFGHLPLLGPVMSEKLSAYSKDEILSVVLNGRYLHKSDLLQLWFRTPVGRKAFQTTHVDELKIIIENLGLSRFDRWGAEIEPVFELFASYVSEFKNSKELIKAYIDLMKKGESGFTLRPDLQRAFTGPLQNAINQFPIQERFEQLKETRLWAALGSDFVGRSVALYTRQLQFPLLSKKIEQTLEALPLRKEWPEAFQVFRNDLAKSEQVQPSEIHSAFPPDQRSSSEKVADHINLIRGLSSFSSFVKDLSPEQQLEMIEFVMGRQNQQPQAMKDATKIINADFGLKIAKYDIEMAFLGLKDKLQFQSPLERALVINTVLAGKNSVLSSPQGLQSLMDHILKPVSPKNRAVAEVLLKALMKAEGQSKSLILSYILAQKPSSDGQLLTEALVLRSLLDAYGAPGVKLAQYLAFTSEFKQFESALEEYQDAAMPISHYDALVLIQKHLGEQWDSSKYQIVGIRGSGSVNIAIEYKNLETGKSEILTILRDEIETKTKEDFRRFNLLVDALTASADKEKFEFITGLLRLIEKSVSLEFDKQHSFEMQKGVQELYRQNFDGWQVQSVDAFEVMKDRGIRMEKAPGVGARQVLKENPEVYNSAMRALMRVEYGILRGLNGASSTPIPMHANPDFHNGQVLIDPVRKIVTILDFGQAVKISNVEREFALDILAIISGIESASSSMNLLQKNAKIFGHQELNLDEAKIRAILAKKDKMEVFVHLISYLERQGFETPLPTVHWLLGANRLAKLGKNVGISIERSFGWLLGMRKVTTTVNAAKSFVDKIINWGRQTPASAGLHLQCHAAQNSRKSGGPGLKL